MCTDKDVDLIKKILLDNSDSGLTELFERHKKLMYSTLQKLFRTGTQEFLDVESSFLSILFDSVKSFDIEKGSKFSTWLSNQVRYAALNLKTYKAKREVTVSENIFDFLENVSTSEDVDLKKEELFQALSALVDKVQDRKLKEVIINRYFSKDTVTSYSDIAKKMNITAQTALNWHNKFIAFAKKNIDKY